MGSGIGNPERDLCDEPFRTRDSVEPDYKSWSLELPASDLDQGITLDNQPLCTAVSPMPTPSTTNRNVAILRLDGEYQSAK